MSQHESADLRLGLGPNSPTIPQPADEPSVSDSADAKPKLPHASFGEEAVDLTEKVLGHERIDTRFSVHNKRHSRTCARSRVILLRQGMIDDAWFDRLQTAVDERWTAPGRSLRELSRAIGFGPNYVQQMLGDRKSPKVQAVLRLADVLGVSVSWLFLGVEMTTEDERLLTLAAKIDQSQKRNLLDLLNSIGAENASAPLREASERPITSAKP